MALRKVAVADDIARAVVVLASDELSGHVTGELVTVAGGMEGRTLHELSKRSGAFRRRSRPQPQDDCRQPPTRVTGVIGVRAIRLEPAATG